MSALEFGDGAGNNSDSYYNGAAPALGNNDWSMGCWIRMNHAPSGIYPGLISHTNDSGSAEGYEIYLSSSGFSGQTWGNGASGSAYVSLAWTSYTGQNVFVVLQRRSGNLELYVAQQGATKSAPDSTVSFTGTTIVAPTNLLIGQLSFLTNWFTNPLGEVFLYDTRSFSAAEVTRIAAGVRVSVVANPLILLPMRTGAIATQVNIGSGGATYNAAKVGTNFVNTPDFFSLGGGLLLTGVG